MIIICFLGIFIGAFALALVASIMNGFEKATHQKLQGIHAQIIMRSYGNELDATKIEEILKNEFPEVKAFSPSLYQQVIAQRPDSDEITNAVLLKGIDPVAEEKTSCIGKKITMHTGTVSSLPELVQGNGIIIGDKLAQALEVNPGDTINLLYITQEKIKGRKVTLNKHEAIVQGIFNTGIEEFDSGLILGSFELCHTMFPNAGVTQFNIQLNSGVDEQATIKKLKQRFHLDVFTWKELYPALVAALKLEKYAMFFILALITLVASMNIISLIFMQIIQKRPDIAIYQALGMHNRTIINLFRLMGIGLATIAAIAGLFAAFIAGLLLEKYPFITLPDTYYVSHLPVQMEWYIFAFVFVLILIMSFIATWIPSRNINSIHAAQVLRFEG